MSAECLDALLKLSHDLGREDRGMAILGEGNTSVRLSGDTFLVKASGSNLEHLQAGQVSECRFDRVLPLLDKSGLSDTEIDQALFDSRVDEKARKPSVETLFHAWLLTLPGIEYIGHTHTISVDQILCSPRGREFAEKRLFPDEIVCCSVASVFVPYTDPGLQLAQVTRAEVRKFIEANDRPPRVILLENHGIIALGPSPASVLAAMLMADKAAKIFVGAVALGGPTSIIARRRSIFSFLDRSRLDYSGF